MSPSSSKEARVSKDQSANIVMYFYEHNDVKITYLCMEKQKLVGRHGKCAKVCDFLEAPAD